MDSILHHLLRIITRHLQFCWQSICRGKWTALSLYMQKMPIPSFLLPVSPYDWLARLKLRNSGGFQEFLPELSGSFLHRINHWFLHLPFERKTNIFLISDVFLFLLIWENIRQNALLLFFLTVFPRNAGQNILLQFHCQLYIFPRLAGVAQWLS